MDNIHKAVNESMARIMKESFQPEPDEDLDEATMAVDFYDFTDAIDRNGFGYIAYNDCKSKDGEDATRFVLEGDGDLEKLKEELESMSSFPGGVVFGTATYKYAPEIKYPTVIIKYANSNETNTDDNTFSPDSYNNGTLGEGLFGNNKVEGGGGMYNKSDIKGFDKEKKEFERIFGTKNFFLNGPTSREGVSLYIKNLKGDYALIKFDRNGEGKVYKCGRIGEKPEFVRNMGMAELHRNNPVSYAHKIWEKYGRSVDMGGLSDEQLEGMIRESIAKILSKKK